MFGAGLGTKTNAAHDYEYRRQLRAQQLAHTCKDEVAKSWAEITWINHLEPLVFYHFERLREEQLNLDHPFHHWYAMVITL